MKAYADLADLPESERVRVIGQVAESGERVGFFVDDGAAADRYIEALTRDFKVVVVERKSNVLVKGTVFVKVGRRADA